MIKICHLTSVHDSFDTRIFHKECMSLSKFGYDVSIISKGEKTFLENVNGITIKHIKFTCKNRAKRVLLLSNKIYRLALLENALIYHFHDPELLRIGQKLKKKGKIVIFDSHEDVPGQIMDKQYIPSYVRKIIALIYRFYEKTVVKKLDAVITVSPSRTEYFKVINRNVYQISNFPILSNDYNQDRNNKYNSMPRSICFAGSICKEWMHENILLALNKIDKITYNLAGSIISSYLDILSNLSGWEKVNYLGHLKYPDVRKLLENSGIGIALYDYCGTVGYNEGTLGNTKIFEYMQAGIPIICSDFKIWKEVVKKTNCGIVVNPRDINEIAKAINYLLDNPEVSALMGKNGINAVNKIYNWQNEERKLLMLYDNLVKKRHETSEDN